MLRMRLNRDERGLVVAGGKKKQNTVVRSKKCTRCHTAVSNFYYIFLPVPPKMCMSICSSRHITNVLTWGSNPKRKITGKHKANTAGPEKTNQVSLHESNTDIIDVLEVTVSRLTDEHIPDTEQEVSREEGDSVEGEGLQAAGTARKVEDPDHHAAQTKVDRPTVHDNPVMALLRRK